MPVYQSVRCVLIILIITGLGACQRDTGDIAAPAPENRSFADAIYHNGNIYTVDDDTPWAEALAVKDGKFTAVGSNEAVSGMQGPGTRTVDLGGRMVMPGVHDGHLHLLLAGLANTHWCLLPRQDGWEGAGNKLEACAGELPAGEWLIAFPYLDEWFENGVHKSVLDEVVSEHPLYMLRWDLHIAAVNSRGLDITLSRGVDETLAGSRIIFDQQGEPTGELVEGATRLASRNLPVYTEEQLETALLWAIDTANRYGVVSVQESGATEPLLRTLKKLDGEGRLSLHVAAYLVWWNENFGEADKETMETLSAERERYRSPHVDVSFAKLWLDGTPVPPHASIIGLDETTGTPDYAQAFIGQDTLNEALVRFDRMGIQVKMHAASAGATRMILDAIAFTRQNNPGSSLMHQLGHSADIAAADLGRLAELGAGADFSPAVWGLAPDDDSFPMKDIINAGTTATMGTDWPVPVIQNNNPFPPLADALERSKQGIDIETGIRMLTINGAITIGAADSTGSIEAGKSADFIVLDRNLLESSTGQIRNTRVLETVFEGKTVYSTDTRTAELEDYKSLRATLDQYAKSVETADVTLMREVFHPQAVAIGSLLGVPSHVTAEDYFEFIDSRSATPQQAGENLLAVPGAMRIDGEIARADIQFANHWCTAGTNHLGLVKHEGRWKIISMMFWVRPSPEEIDHSRYPEGYCTQLPAADP